MANPNPSGAQLNWLEYWVRVREDEWDVDAVVVIDVVSEVVTEVVCVDVIDVVGE